MLVDKIQRLVPTDRCPVSTQVGYRTNDWTLPEPVTPSYLAAAPTRPTTTYRTTHQLPTADIHPLIESSVAAGPDRQNPY